MQLDLEIHKKFPEFSLDISLKSNSRRIGVLGASGAGKSMLLKCISGLVTPSQGSIVLNDRTLFDSAKKINLSPRQRRVGFLFQSYALFPHLTVYQNITFGLDGIPLSRQREIAEGLMARFHIQELGKRLPPQLSGGQQQRVALARALAADPEILFLDEPFSALDDHLRAHMIRTMLEDLKDFKGTVLLVSHNIEEVYRLCDTLMILHQGHVDAFGPKEKLFQQPVTTEAARITGCKNISPAERDAEGHLHIPQWGITVKTAAPIGAGTGWAGIRANHIHLADQKHTENVYQAWIADRSEAPFRVTLYLKFNRPANHLGDFDVQWEMSRDTWHSIRELKEPLSVTLPPRHLLFLEP